MFCCLWNLQLYDVLYILYFNSGNTNSGAYTQYIEVKFSFQSSSIDFLASEGFDFNKCIKEGEKLNIVYWSFMKVHFIY